MAAGTVGSGDGPDDKHYELNSDDYIWSVLTECNDAAFVEDDKWMVHDREYLSFTITSEVLGVYRVAMYVTEDGYLWTNAFSYPNGGADRLGTDTAYLFADLTNIIDEDAPVEDCTTMHQPRRQKKNSGPVMGGM